MTPFVDGKLLVGLGSGLYMLILGLYTLSISYLMVPTCFRGAHPSTKKTIWVKGQLELPDAKYRLTLLEPKTGKPSKCSQAWEICRWIHEDGVISGSAFCADMEKFTRSDDFKSILRAD